VVLRYTDEGRIYGVTFIDHGTMNVLNGSRLGKEFSANAINDRFNNPTKVPVNNPDNITPIVVPPLEQMPEDTTSHSQSPTDTEQHTQSSGGQHQSSDSHSTTDYGDNYFILPGLDLFQTGQSFNPDEEEFRRRMQRKKKGPRHRF